MVNEKEDKKEVISEEQNMFRMRKSQDMNEVTTCLPPTYARQPPDGREITLNCIDLQSSNVFNGKISSLSCEMYTSVSVHEDSGVFIDTDTPSPELDFNTTHPRGMVSSVAVTQIKYKLNGDSDGDTGVTSQSSDSMDELDSCPSPNYKPKRQILDKSRNPSSDFLSETAPNGVTNNNDVNNSHKSSELSKSVKQKIAMFDIQSSDNSEDIIDECYAAKESLKELPKSTTTPINEYLISDRSPNGYQLSTPNGKHELKSERVFTSDVSDKQYKERSIESQNSSSLSLTSDQSHPNASAVQYSGHLQPSYLRYSSLGSSNDNLHTNTGYSGIGVHKPLLNGNLLSSILETRKQNASKLKGLIIPDVPTATQPAVSKTLPTIFSNTSTSSLLLTAKPEEVSALTARTLSQSQSQTNISSNFATLRQPLLSEPWAAENGSIPKYSPAFKRRQLELPRSLSLLNNANPVSQDNVDSFSDSWNRSNSMTTMAASDPQFQFSLSHSKPVIPLMPETAVGSPNMDGVSNATNTKPSLEEQLALSFNDSYRHSSIQRRYSADYSLEKRSSTDSSMNSIYKSTLNAMTTDRNAIQNNKTYNSMNYLDIKTNPIINEKKNILNNGSDNEYAIHKNFDSNCQNAKNFANCDYSDDDSSTISHKTSEGSSVRADDSASDTASDSLDQTFGSELSRPKVLGTQLTVLKNTNDGENVCVKNDNNSDSVKNFRALAEKWEQRSGLEGVVNNTKNIAPPLPPKPNPALSRIPPSLMPRTKKSVPTPEPPTLVELPKPIVEPIVTPITPNVLKEIKQMETTLKEIELNLNTDFESPKATLGINTRSDSLSSDGNSSDNSSKTSVASMSRSVSDICKVFEISGTDNSSIKSNRSNSNSSLNSIKTIINNDNKTIPDIEIEAEKVDTTDEKEIQLNEEKEFNQINTENDKTNPKICEEKLLVWDKSRVNEDTGINNHQRMSSMDSLASDSGASSSGTAVRSLGPRTSSATNLRDSLYGSVSSLASSTSIISPQELQQLIDEANQSLESNDINSHNIQVVVLHREYKSSGSIGITLAGGSDCETKEITVHRVINGSLTDRDGRIRKGDRILSINGKILKGVTHKEALDIMKAPRPEVVIVLSRINTTNISPENGFHSRQSSSDLNDTTNGHSFHSLNEDIISSTHLSTIKDMETNLDTNYKILRAELQKDVAGLGFILEGGKDSPLGGPADKEGTLASGDEVLTVNDHLVNNMTRTEAWNFLKKLPEGHVVLMVKRKKY
ncbi:unnamed protein product [Medioppia subpectinata]|uniref:PDZ domain-containing protein n=1 Tax=Medioppia subpectinata TaxID=1979941 RepID=A0A7R9KJF3_9ACAR|nr:unnamed protein product [Medioppia subpectinata]CAG2104506.1 unnamed protein product [Medioppia subpectinata]